MAETRRRYGTRTRVKSVTKALATSVAAASRATGIPEDNIRRWMNDPEMQEYAAKTREEIADESRALSVKVLGEIYRRLPDYEPRDLSVLYGILVDKGQLLSGQATARSETRDLTGTFDDEEWGKLKDVLREAANAGT